MVSSVNNKNPHRVDVAKWVWQAWESITTESILNTWTSVFRKRTVEDTMTELMVREYSDDWSVLFEEWSVENSSNAQEDDNDDNDANEAFYNKEEDLMIELNETASTSLIYVYSLGLWN